MEYGNGISYLTYKSKLQCIFEFEELCEYQSAISQQIYANYTIDNLAQALFYYQLPYGCYSKIAVCVMVVFSFFLHAKDTTHKREIGILPTHSSDSTPPSIDIFLSRVFHIEPT